jgi:hypothetical protein
LCSFSIFDSKSHPNPKKPKLSDIIKYDTFIVDINVIGLRGLVSNSVMPVTKPFVKLSVKSMLPQEAQQLHEDKFILPLEAGSNPNFNAKIKFELPLPENTKYTPSMTCTVFDQVFLGMSQPVIGTFQIPIGSLRD